MSTDDDNKETDERLARDAQRLARAGFTPERAIPVDLFPQTAHVETVLSLVRNRLGPTAAPA